MTDRERTRKARQFIPLFCVVVVPLLSTFRLKEMAEQHDRTGVISVSKIILYVPSIIYLVCYPVMACFVPLENHAKLGSSALRFLCLVLGGLLGFYELYSFLLCHNSNEVYCVAVVQTERIGRSLMFFGLSVFVFRNDFYPRATKWNLFCLAYLLSATLYTYVLAIFAEETHIYYAIKKRNNHTEHSYLPVRRAHSNWVVPSDDGYTGSEDYNKSPESLLEGILEMICAATCEFLVVAISIIIGIICVAGEEEQDPPQVQRNPEPRQGQCNFKKIIWIVSALIPCIGICILIPFDIKKTDPDNWWYKMIFYTIHISVLFIGVILCCLFFFGAIVAVPEDMNALVVAEDEADENAPDNHSTENLERYLLYFGTTGFFFYTSFGLIHSIYLIPSEDFAFGSVIADLVSMIQGFAQTVVILHCDMKTNTYGYWAGVSLFLVNVAMFLLDLFDAATLGIYANPVPVGSNVMWTMLVRGLGPFVVFYRFHSMAIIAEVVEHNI